MTHGSIYRIRRTLFSFTLVLMFFLVVADTFIITQQTKIITREVVHHTNHEFDLFSKLVIGSLTKGDYVSIQEAVLNWGKEQENLAELSIATANGFTIASYKRDAPVEYSQLVHTTLPYGHNNTATITMIKDTSKLLSDIKELKFKMIGFSILLVTILGIVLQRVAVQPLQNAIRAHELTEDKLQMQAKELQDSNQELESYSYSIAHDLRTPLRGIIGFCQILKDESRSKLSNEEKQHFDRIISASKRMADMIDYILNLGRVTRSDLHYEEVNLSELAKNSLKKYCTSESHPSVHFHAQDNLITMGDKHLLSMLLDNLLGNAYKFSCLRENTKIEFGCTANISPEHDVPTYFVRDNGVGFDIQYANKLFKPFQRLHDDKEFEGNGVGLATAQRIVKRHGGNIWAEANEGEGATFYFTLNKHNRNVISSTQ